MLIPSICLNNKGILHVSAGFEFSPKRARFAAAAIALAVTTAAVAQDQAGPGTPNNASALQLPENPQIFGSAMPSVVKATAIVNGEVITQTDVAHRLMLLAIGEGGQIPAEQVEPLRQQVLRNLIDEVLEIQAAKTAEIKVTDKDIDKTLTRVAGNVKMNPDQLADFLKSHGSSIRTLRRQIEGEIAWRRLQQQKIESSINVGDEEVKAVIERMNASKGTEEYKVGEIFLSATPASMPQVMANANQIIEQLRQGGSFVGYARQYSEASTAAVGGDLGWVRPGQLPDQLAAVIRTMRPGQVSAPIQVAGGVSIVAVQDTRKILSADPRNAVLSLKQVSISFPAGTTREQAEERVARFAQAAQNVGGCGGAERIATDFNGEVVTSDQVPLRQLPAALQEMMLPMQVGQATRPFGSIEEGVRTLVICGRDEVDPTAPTYDEVMNQLSEERINTRARRYLRDLRRDAVIEFR
jgi:peptidyl-prolyl cis-trans isomerase SurA